MLIYHSLATYVIIWVLRPYIIIMHFKCFQSCSNTYRYCSQTWTLEHQYQQEHRRNTWYQCITCKNQPKLYFSVGLKYSSTENGKIPWRYFSALDQGKSTVLYNKEKINPVALTVDFVFPFGLKNQLWLVGERPVCIHLCTLMVVHVTWYLVYLYHPPEIIEFHAVVGI